MESGEQSGTLSSNSFDEKRSLHDGRAKAGQGSGAAGRPVVFLFEIRYFCSFMLHFKSE